jgi:GNAT superfamily N-acetyltransferase
MAVRTSTNWPKTVRGRAVVGGSVTFVRTTTINSDDERAFAAWYAVVDAVQQEARPGVADWSARELRAFYGSANRQVFDLAAIDGDRTVGAARVYLPMAENLHLVTVRHVGVLPDSRRSGAGAALLAAAERIAREAGRDTVETIVDEPDWPSPAGPGRRFLLRNGFRCAMVAPRRELALPLDLDALEADCRQRASGYVLRRWRDRCPDDLLDDRAMLAGRMTTDAPTGDLDHVEEFWDGDRIRGNEKITADQGRTVVAVGAVHRGRLVGFTEIAIPNAAPEQAYQWDTLVLREHRGHRLGLWLKIDNLRQLAEVSPATTTVTTYNADSNAPMIAVNDALGFTVNGALTTWTKRLNLR